MDRPLPNRCAPDGSLHATPARGTLMGNRGGRLHRPDRTLGPARWRSRAWIACESAFRGRHRDVWGAGYTELFFLDEATALAAGHRPCFECRRAEAVAFAAAWARAAGGPPPRAGAMDRVLHAERTGARTTVDPASLPLGAIFATAGGFHLCVSDGALPWSFDGYGRRRSLPARPVVAVTPPAMRAVLAAGYRPRLHATAGP